jgi:N-acetylneuraminate synthase
MKTIEVARKSLVARQRIRAGETFSATNLGVKRPGLGLEPILYWDFIDKIATRDYNPDQQIDQ